MDNLGHVLLRCDLNVPIEEAIVDDYRIKRSAEIIPFIKERSKTITLLTHLGRPNSHDESFSTKHLISSLENYTKFKIHHIDTTYGKKAVSYTHLTLPTKA